MVCLKQNNFMMLSERMRVSPSAIPRSGRPDYEPQRSAERDIYSVMKHASERRTLVFDLIKGAGLNNGLTIL